MSENTGPRHWLRQNLYQYYDANNGIVFDVFLGSGVSDEHETYGVTYYPLRCSLIINDKRMQTYTSKVKFDLQYPLLETMVKETYKFLKSLVISNGVITGGEPRVSFTQHVVNHTTKHLYIEPAMNTGNVIFRILDPVVSNNPYSIWINYNEAIQIWSLLNQVKENFSILSSNNIIALTQTRALSKLNEIDSKINDKLGKMNDRIAGIDKKISVIGSIYSNNTRGNIPADFDLDDETLESIPDNNAQDIFTNTYKDGFDHIQVESINGNISNDNKVTLHGFNLLCHYFHNNIDSVRSEYSAYMAKSKFELLGYILNNTLQPNVELEQIISDNFSEYDLILSEMIKYYIRCVIKADNLSPLNTMKLYPIYSKEKILSTMNTPSIRMTICELILIVSYLMSYGRSTKAIPAVSEMKSIQIEYIEISQIYVVYRAVLFSLYCLLKEEDLPKKDEIIQMNNKVIGTTFLDSFKEKYHMLSSGNSWLVDSKTMEYFINEAITMCDDIYYDNDKKEFDPYTILKSTVLKEVILSDIEVDPKQFELPVQTEQNTNTTGDNTRYEGEFRNLNVGDTFNKPLPNYDRSNINNDNSNLLDWSTDTMQQPVEQQNVHEDISIEDFYIRVMNMIVSKEHVDRYLSLIQDGIQFNDIGKILVDNNFSIEWLKVKRVLDQNPEIRSVIEVKNKISVFNEDINVILTRLVYPEVNTSQYTESDFQIATDVL
jgi:hypothetical protein